MRLAFRIDLNSIAPYAALCAATVALSVLSTGVNAQEFALPQSTTMAESADAGSATLASPVLAAVASPDATATTATEVGQLAGDAMSIPADAASVNDIALDDQMLSRQRGGAVGMLMVAATPQLMRANGGSNHVTLWDELAPPTPMPIPVDASRTSQGNVANYQRK
jgi:hypothetical protein